MSWNILDHITTTSFSTMVPSPISIVMVTPATSSVLPSLPQLGLHLQETVLAVQRLRVEHSRVVELSSKLVQERLDLEQQLEDMQAMHKNKMEQMASRGKQLGSCQHVEQLSGVGAAVIQDVKMLRQQFRHARQEVDSLEDQLEEIEKRNIGEKEASVRKEEEQQTLEKMAKLLKYNVKKLEEEQIILGRVLQAGREANNCLHQDRIVMERMVALVEKEKMGLEECMWEKETGNDVEVKCLGEEVCGLKVRYQETDIDDSPEDFEAEENRLEVVLGEKLCELESVQNCVEGSHKIVAQMRSCTLGEEEVGLMVKLEEELGEVVGLWEEEQKGWEDKLKMTRNKIDSLEDQKEDRERILQEINVFGSNEGSEKVELCKKVRVVVEADTYDDPIDSDDNKEEIKSGDGQAEENSNK